MRPRSVWPRRVARAVVGVLLAVAVIAGIGVLTRVEYSPASSEGAALRLAWRARVPLVEECRRLTEAERAELPVHMRREVVCEGRVASYRLEVAVDGLVVHGATVSGAGARGDRPLYVFESLPLEPGTRRLEVEFSRVTGPADSTGRRAREGAGTIPARLRLRREVAVEAGDVVLVTYDAGRRELVLR